MMMTESGRLKTIEIDFYVRKSTSLLGSTILICALLLAGVVGSAWLNNQRKLQALERQVSSIEREQKHKTASILRSSADPQSKMLLEQWGGVQQSLNQPWFDILGQLESTLSPDIAVLQFKPNLKEKQLELLFEVKDLQAMVAWMERIKVTGLFGNPRLMSQRTLLKEVGNPIQVQINLELLAKPTRMGGKGE